MHVGGAIAVTFSVFVLAILLAWLSWYMTIKIQRSGIPRFGTLDHIRIAIKACEVAGIPNDMAQQIAMYNQQRDTIDYPLGLCFINHAYIINADNVHTWGRADTMYREYVAAADVSNVPNLGYALHILEDMHMVPHVSLSQPSMLSRHTEFEEWVTAHWQELTAQYTYHPTGEPVEEMALRAAYETRAAADSIWAAWIAGNDVETIRLYKPIIAQAINRSADLLRDKLFLQNGS